MTRNYYSMTELGAKLKKDRKIISCIVDALQIPTYRRNTAKCIDDAGLETLMRHFEPRLERAAI